MSHSTADNATASAGTTLPPPLSRGTGWPWTRAVVDSPVPLDGPLPRVSVIVPSFRQGRFIEATLRSVLLQDYPGIQLIVIDGGSTDETVDVLRRYDSHIDYWVSEPDRGQTHAINKGLARASGEIVTYLNSDDLLHPGAVRRIVAGFMAHPEAGVVYGECVYVDEQGRERYRQAARVDGLREYLRIWERFRSADYITQPEAFIRGSVLRQAGPFREDLHSVMDFEMWLRLLSRGVVFQFIPHPIAHFRTYPSQKSSVDPGNELGAVIEEYVRNPAVGLSAREQEEMLNELRVARAQILVRAGMAANFVGRYPRAVRYSLAAIRHSLSVLGSYLFWSVLAHPVKRFVPAVVREFVRRLSTARRPDGSSAPSR